MMAKMMKARKRQNSGWLTDEQNTISGTSMSSPHITGLAAYFLSLLGPKAPQELCEYIKDTATIGTITSLPDGTINAIAFNGVSA